MSKKRYIAYSRCSTEEQGRKGHSHEYQVEGIRRSGAVTVAGLEETGYYSDTVTGTRFDNRASGLDAAYKICERNRGVIGYLFVYRWDRLGRDVADCFDCIKKFRAVGVEVNCPDEWIDFKDPSYPLILSVKFGMAQSESMRISDRTRDGIYQANLSGIWTNAAPVGYRKGQPKILNGKERRVCEVVPDVSEVVKTCFERYATGSTKAELFKQFGKTLGIAKSQFVRMFHNPFYCGLIAVKAHRSNPAKVVDGLHEPIISRDMFDRCQIVLENAEHPTKGKTWNLSHTFAESEFWLKGVVKCPQTGRNLTAYKSRGKSGRKFGYYAAQKIKGGQIVPVEKAHHLASLALQGFRIDAEVGKEIRIEVERQLSERTSAAKRKADEAKRGLERVRQRIDNVKTEFADGNLTAVEYREFKDSFDRQAIGFDAQILEAGAMTEQNDQVVVQVLELLVGIDTVFAASNPGYKNRILRAIFPEGFSLDLKHQKVRTPCVNEVILSICSKSITSQWLETANGPTETSRPVKGGEGGRYRTHLNLLKTLLAA